MPLADGQHEGEDDCWSESSTLSYDENSQANYSAASPLQSTASAVIKPSTKQVVALIKPKERKGQVLQALTLPSPVKNALEDIGHTSRQGCAVLSLGANVMILHFEKSHDTKDTEGTIHLNNYNRI